MPWRTDLLDPIPGDNSCGVDLRYDPIYDEIKEARREEVDVPQGAWATDRKIADWPFVIRLCNDVLNKQSKDLQIAVWLTEAMLRREGLSGLKGGLDYLQGLIGKFWENLYPELNPDMEDIPGELRAGPLDWLGSKLDLAIKAVPLNPEGHSWATYMDSRTVPLEEAVKNDSAKKTARQKLLDSGKIAQEAFDGSVDLAPKAFYKQLIGDIDGSLAALKTLGKLCDDRFGDVSPSFGGLRKSLEDVRIVVFPFLKKKLELDPDPPEAEPVPETVEAAEAVAPDPAAGTESGESGTVLSLDPTSYADAVARVAAAAKYLRRAEPGNPSSYLMLRGLRWGEVRSSGSPPRQRLLEAPALAVRVQLKSFLLDQKWAELLEAAELAMAQPCGRGWLDLQRYAVTACDRLGAPYYLAGKAIREALLDYLNAVPQLVDMMMMDDTPTANAETQTWIATEKETAEKEAPAAPAEPGRPEGGRKLFDIAMDAVRSGDTNRGIGLLTNELSRESSTRGRFFRKTELAAALVASGREAVALPLLQDLSAQVDSFKLEEWEGGPAIAQTLVLLHKCMSKLGGDAAAQQALYLRICRLDPLQALSCGPQA